MSVVELDASLAVDCADRIGESPAWDAAAGRLLWTDNSAGVVHEARRDEAGGWRETARHELNRPIAAVAPRVAGGLVVAAGTEILLMDDDGRLSPFARIDVDGADVRLNDAKCDPRGRLWAGTLDNDLTAGGRPIRPGRCALYRIDPDGTVAVALRGVTLSNGLDWSSDGRTLYYIDTVTRRVDAFDFDLDAGSLGARRTVVELARGEGLPDGLCVDDEDCLWVAVVGRSEIRRYTASGELLARVAVATPTATSCAFGGEDGRELFITTARARLPRALIESGFTHGFDVEGSAAGVREPGAGALFSLRAGVSGPAARPFAG